MGPYSCLTLKSSTIFENIITLSSMHCKFVINRALFLNLNNGSICKNHIFLIYIYIERER
jgi:hypothetical protein